MQVSHAQTDSTVASIGTGKSSGFGMATSAELMLNLADGLYQNKRLAMVREVICNAWDAHICSGNQDKPVLVTLNSSELNIQDQAGGIPDHLINDIYCTYGASTKVFSNEETGGFGFGSKAPYAYTDQFVVVNRNQGKKTIYSMIKSDPNEEGKPSATPVVSVPIPDGEIEGLEVQINLKAGDWDLITSYLEYFASWGDMNISVNGNPPMQRKTYPALDTNQHWLLSNESPIYMGVGEQRLNRQANLAIKIGTVMYPIVDDERYNTMAIQISDFLQKSNNFRCFVILAEPGRVVPTPSRESIQMNTQAIEYIHDAMYDFCQRFNAAIESETPHIVERMTQLLTTSNDQSLYRKKDWSVLPAGVTSSYLRIYGGSDTINANNPFCADEVVALNNMMCSLSTLPTEVAKGVSAAWIELYKEQVKLALGDQPEWLSRFGDIYRASPASGTISAYPVTSAMKKKIWEEDLEPVNKGLTALYPNTNTDPKKEWTSPLDWRIYDGEKGYYYRFDSRLLKFDDIRKGYTDMNVGVALTSFRKEAIICYSWDNVSERAASYGRRSPENTFHNILRTETNIDKSDTNWATGMVIVKVPRRKTDAEKVIGWFKANGYSVHDFTKKFSWEIEEKVKEVEAKEDTNFFTLHSYLSPHSVTKKTSSMRNKTVLLSTYQPPAQNRNPEYILNSIDGYMEDFTGSFDTQAITLIRKLYGHKTSLIHGERSVRALTKSGTAKHLITPLLTLAIKWVQEKEVRENFLYNIMSRSYDNRCKELIKTKLGNNSDELWFYRAVNSMPQLARKLFGRSFKYSDSLHFKAMFVMSVKSYARKFKLNTDEQKLLTTLNHYIAAVPYGPVFAMWNRKLSSTELHLQLQLMNQHAIAQALMSQYTNPALKLMAVSLVTNLLKGIRSK